MVKELALGFLRQVGDPDHATLDQHVDQVFQHTDQVGVQGSKVVWCRCRGGWGQESRDLRVVDQRVLGRLRRGFAVKGADLPWASRWTKWHGRRGGSTLTLSL